MSAIATAIHSLLAVVIAAAVIAVPAPGRAGEFVSVQGRQLIAPDGRPLLIRGINLGNWLVPEGYMFKFKVATSPQRIHAATARLLGDEGAAAFWRTFRERYITHDDIRYIAALGFNVVRVPISHRLFMSPGAPPDFTPAFEGEGWALLDRLIAWCRQEGLRVVIDLHAAPGGQTGTGHDDGSGYPLLFYVPRHQAATVALWRAIAARYANEPAVLGYELLNEPVAPHHDTLLLNPRIEPLYRRIVAAVREVDANHIVILAGGQWSSTFRMLGPPFDAKAVYTYHRFWCKTERVSIAEYLDFSNRYEVPVWLGETGEADDAWNRAFRELHERHGIGWAFWTYKNLDTASSVVSVRRPRHWEQVIAAVDETAAAGAQAAADAGGVPAALAEYLDNLQLDRCRVNDGYVASLGLSPGPSPGPAAP